MGHCRYQKRFVYEGVDGVGELCINLKHHLFLSSFIREGQERLWPFFYVGMVGFNEFLGFYGIIVGLFLGGDKSQM